MLLKMHILKLGVASFISLTVLLGAGVFLWLFLTPRQLKVDNAGPEYLLTRQQDKVTNEHEWPNDPAEFSRILEEVYPEVYYMGDQLYLLDGKNDAGEWYQIHFELNPSSDSVMITVEGPGFIGGVARLGVESLAYRLGAEIKVVAKAGERQLLR